MRTHKQVSRVPLTLRQQQVLCLVWDGHTNKQIAHALGISVRTVDVHRAVLMQLLGAHNVAQLFRAAHAQGWLTMQESKP